MRHAVASCLRLLVQLALRAASRAFAKTGKRIAARIAMIAMTTSSSINVNPLHHRLVRGNRVTCFIPFVPSTSSQRLLRTRRAAPGAYLCGGAAAPGEDDFELPPMGWL